MEYLGLARLTASGLDDNDGGDQTNAQARREYLTYCVSTIDNNNLAPNIDEHMIEKRQTNLRFLDA